VSISPADEVEQLVVKAIQAELARSPKLRALLVASSHDDAVRWRRERDEARARMVEAGQLYGARTIDRDTFDGMHGAAKADFDKAAAALGALDSELTLPSVDDISERWETLTLPVQRAVVEALIERIVVAPGGKGTAGFNPARLSKPVWRA
jgi:hypothetical protein